MRLVHDKVLPSAGFSVRAGSAWIDFGTSVTTANIEQQRNIIAATSLRFGFGGSKAAVTEASQTR